MKIAAVWWLFVSGIRKEYTRSIVLAVVLACFALVLGAFVAPTGSVAAKGLQGNDAVSTLVITPAVGPNAQPFNAQTEEAVRADARLDSATPQFTVGLVPNDERLKSEGVDSILWAKTVVPGAHPDGSQETSSLVQQRSRYLPISGASIFAHCSATTRYSATRSAWRAAACGEPMPR